MTVDATKISLEPGSDPRLAKASRLVGPHAVSFVTTISPAGVANTAPFTFIMACGYEPPMICFVCTEQKHFVKYGYDPQKINEPIDAIKDTIANLRDTGEFVVTPADKGLRSAIMIADKPWPRGMSEIAKAGLTLTPATKVRVPLIREAKLSLECRLVQMVPIPGSQMILGEVIMVHAAPDAVLDGIPDVTMIGPVFEGVQENHYFELGEPVPLTRHRPWNYDEFSSAAGKRA